MFPSARAAALLLSLAVPTATLAQTQEIYEGKAQTPSLGQLVAGSSHILLLRVDWVDRQRHVIHFQVAAVLKGEPLSAGVRQAITEPNVKEAVPLARDQEAILAWARPGRTAVAFLGAGRATVSVGNCWYSAEIQSPSDWAPLGVVLRQTLNYVGPVDRLRKHVVALLARKPVVITVAGEDENALLGWEEPPVYRDWLRGKKGKVRRIQAAYGAENGGDEDFVGWGVGGPEAVPALLAGLRDPDSCVRAGAAEDLGQLGPAGCAALVPLHTALRDEDAHVRIHAAAALLRLGDDAGAPLSALVTALEHPDETARAAAAGALAELGWRSIPALPALAVALRDPNLAVRCAAAFALGQIAVDAPRPGFRPGAAAEALARTLVKDEDPRARSWAGHALLRFGADAWTALPALRTALRDGNPGVAAVAADVLARFRPPAVEVLTEAFLDPECADRAAVAGWLGAIGPRAKAAIPFLRRVLGEEHTGLRVRAVNALRSIDAALGQKAGPGVLHAILETEEPRYAPGLALFLLRWVIPDRASVPQLVTLATSGHSDIRSRRLAVEALGRMGPGAGDAASALKAALRDNNPLFAVAVARALWRVCRDREALAFLARTVTAADSVAASAAARALGEIGPDAAQAAPALWAALARAAPGNRAEIALALWRVGRTPTLFGVAADHRDRVFDTMTDLCQKGEFSDRMLAVGALAQTGDRRAAGVLIRALDEEDAYSREYAAEALGQLPPGTPGAVSALRAALGDRDRFVRLAALSALCRLHPRHPQAPAALRRIAAEDEWQLLRLTDELIPFGAEARPLAWPFRRALLRDGFRDAFRFDFPEAVRVLEAIEPDALALTWGPAGVNADERARWADLTPAQLEGLWDDLASDDPCRSHRAVWGMALGGERAAEFLKARLRPVEPVRQERLTELVAALGSGRYSERAGAMKELEALAELAEPALRRALGGEIPLEVRRRVEQLLAKMALPPAPELARRLRAVVALGHSEAAGARAVLEALARGAPEARLTQEAWAALRLWPPR